MQKGSSQWGRGSLWGLELGELERKNAVYDGGPQGLGEDVRNVSRDKVMHNLIGHSGSALYYKSDGEHTNHQKNLPYVHMKYMQNWPQFFTHLQPHHGPRHCQLLPRVLQLPPNWPSYLPLLPRALLLWAPLHLDPAVLFFITHVIWHILYGLRSSPSVSVTRRAGINWFSSMLYSFLLEQWLAWSRCSETLWSWSTCLCFLYSEPPRWLSCLWKVRISLWLPGPYRIWSSSLLPAVISSCFPTCSVF